MAEHLVNRVEVDEETRDRLRDELGMYAYDAVMLDGVSRNRHLSAVVNTPYRLNETKVAEKEVTDSGHEALFTEIEVEPAA